MKIKIKKLSPLAVSPWKAHLTDAGFDLYATSKTYDNDNNVVYGCGLAFEIPEGYMGLVFPRSSNARTSLLLSNSVGVIDSGYRGEVTAKIRWIHSRIRFGCDTKAQIAECDRAIELIAKYGYKGEFFMYTMLHGDIHECLERINHWRERVIRKQNGEDVNATYVHSQPYRDPHHAN